MSSRNMSSLKLPRKQIFEEYQGPFHSLVPSRQLTPSRLKARTPTGIHKFYRMPVVKRIVSETLKYMDEDTNECTVNSLGDPTDVYWHRSEISTWKPETCQSATLTLCEGCLYLIGGISKTIHSQVIVYHPMTKKWEKNDSRGCQARFGHSTITYNRELIVFGGGTEYNQAHKQRECINGIYKFHSSISEWRPLENKGVHIQPRKYHAGCMLGKQFIIQGGQNSKNKLLDELVVYDFSKMGWIPVNFAGFCPGFRAKHTMQVVLNPDQVPENIFQVPPTRYLNVKTYGVYLFGGLTLSGEPTNDLNILDLSQSPPMWVVPNTTGVYPSARHSHTMLYISKISILLIYGGKGQCSSSEQLYLSDIFMLRVDTLHWNQVRIHGEIPCGRSGHCMEVLGSRVFIFGGISQKGFCSSDIYIMELNPRNVKSYLQDERHGLFIGKN